MSELTEWSNFYVILGSSAGALIGLQFVVLTLIAQRPSAPANEGTVPAEAGAAFATPSVVHFAVSLLLSAVGAAPWHTMRGVEACWAIVGLGGTGYTFLVAARVRAQKVYRPVFEDWLFHFFLPLAAYAILIVSAVVTYWRARPALFCVAAATLLLLFVGIHNAWDGVTYHVYSQGHRSHKEDPPNPPQSPGDPRT
jgi:hypothetical protein